MNGPVPSGTLIVIVGLAAICCAIEALSMKVLLRMLNRPVYCADLKCSVTLLPLTVGSDACAGTPRRRAVLPWTANSFFCHLHDALTGIRNHHRPLRRLRRHLPMNGEDRRKFIHPHLLVSFSVALPAVAGTPLPLASLDAGLTCSQHADT